MRRAVARLFPVWAWLALSSFLAAVALELPWWFWAAVVLPAAALCLVRPPAARSEPIEVDSPLRGRWTVVHSPADRVPSHGVRTYAQAYAIDLIHPRPEGTAPSYPIWGGFEDPEAFSSFGEPVLAVADGTVVRVLDRMRDHRSRTSWLAFAYMMVVDGFRDLGGPAAVVGNHVVVEQAGGVFALYAHLRRGSVSVAVGDRVVAGGQVGVVGNSGNTSEPHLHFQLMDRADCLAAAGLPFRFRGLVQRGGEVDPSWSTKPARSEITPGLPANFQVFSA